MGAGAILAAKRQPAERPMPEERTASGSVGTIRALDGVRGLAIALVLWCHLDAFTAGPAWAGGGTAVAPGSALHVVAQDSAIGVLLFFVLSGFLLFLPYARALLASPGECWPHPGTFYRRRIRRIFPAYLVVLLVILVVTSAVALASWKAPGHSLVDALPHLPWAAALAGVPLLFDLHRVTYEAVAGNVDGPLWSLAVEWQFYLVLPALALVLARVNRPRRVVLGLCALMALGLVVRGAATWAHYARGFADPVDAPGLLGLAFQLLYGIKGKYLEVFALGMLVSLVYVAGIEQRRLTPRRQRVLGWALVPLLALALVVWCAWAMAAGRFSDPLAFYWPVVAKHGWWAVGWAIAGEWAGGVCAAVALLIVLCLPGSWGRVFSWRLLTGLGAISYSLYLWHWPLLRLLLSDMSGTSLPMGEGRVVLALGVVLAWAGLLYWFVERPFLPRRHRVGRAPV